MKEEHAETLLKLIKIDNRKKIKNNKGRAINNVKGNSHMVFS